MKKVLKFKKTILALILIGSYLSIRPTLWSFEQNFKQTSWQFKALYSLEHPIKTAIVFLGLPDYWL